MNREMKKFLNNKAYNATVLANIMSRNIIVVVENAMTGSEVYKTAKSAEQMLDKLQEKLTALNNLLEVK